MKQKKQKLNSLPLVVCILIILLGGAFWFWNGLRPVRGNASVVIEIPAGASSRDIANLLQQNGLIRNAQVFQAMLWLNHDIGRLKAGAYSLKQGMSPDEIMNLLIGGKSISNTVRFTIPEGFTVEQIAARLSQLGIVDSASFLNEVDHGSFNSPLLASLPSGAPVRHRLEGYLFPNTYEVYKGTSAHEIVQLLLDGMQQEVTPDLIAKWKGEGLSVHEGLTLASLVEREARVASERAEIAGVMMNRLHAKPPMKLQIDATIQYVIGQKPELSLEDLNHESPYNTYLHFGLPPGPIACPGHASIVASSLPQPSEYLFYVTKKDGSGTHYFAKTYTEQLANEAKSMQNAAKGS